MRISDWSSDVCSSDLFFGLGGDVTFVRGTASAGYYHPIFEDWTISVRGTGGTMAGIGEDTLISDRFFKGGGQPRGFEYGGSGPRDATTGDALGGKTFNTVHEEPAFPIAIPSNPSILRPP